MLRVTWLKSELITVSNCNEPSWFPSVNKHRYCPSAWCYTVIAAVLEIATLIHSSLYFSITFSTVKNNATREMDYEGVIEPESVRVSAHHHLKFLQCVQST